jgi:hypothetical protein
VRLVPIAVDGAPRLGVVRPNDRQTDIVDTGRIDGIAELHIDALLAGGPEALGLLARAVTNAPASAVLEGAADRLLPVVPNPGKIICIGLNYRDHAARLLAPLATDIAEWSLACGRPNGSTLVFPGREGRPWADHDWRNWRKRVSAPVADTAELDGHASTTFGMRSARC